MGDRQRRRRRRSLSIHRGRPPRPGPPADLVRAADGNVYQLDRIRAEAAARNIGITIICDFIHVTGYL